jgi:phage terminase large subunit
MNDISKLSPIKGLKVETVIKLDRFEPRDYQLNLCRKFESGTIKRFLVIWPRRSGKDICAFNLLLRASLRRVGNYFYVFPTFSQGRRILWDAIDIQGRRILHYYAPDEIIESRNEQQMRLRLINGSQIQILGSDDFDSSIVGTNCMGMIFSEYALQDPRGFAYSLPILRASDGWAMFISTPRGKNALWELFNRSQGNPDWFCEKLSIDDTQHVDLEQIAKDIREGEMSQDLAMQEWWCSFDLGVEGSYYTKYIDDLRRRGQVTHIPWEPYHPVHTAWDLGWNDPTVIIFFQIIGPIIRIIDYYQNNKSGLEHYAKIVKEKPYAYGKHIAPHDIAVHELSSGLDRWSMMHDLGITFIRREAGDKVPGIEDGIEAVRRNLPKMWINEASCGPLIKALENYRQEYDPKRQVYKDKPVHDHHSHAADAMRYLCVGLNKIKSNTSAAELEKRFRETVYGEDQSHYPSVFRDDLPPY